jgi:hypothetical protein
MVSEHAPSCSTAQGCRRKSLLQFFQEVLFIQIVGDFAINQIPELLGMLEIVHRDDVVFAALV